MTNEEILANRRNVYAAELGGNTNVIPLCEIEELLELARSDERAKMTQEKFAEYFNSLQGGEVASAILTNLLRRGVTDDDLRGLRLQWITDERAKLSKEAAKVWISWGTHFTFQRLTAVKPELFEYNGGVAYLNNGNAECIILPYFSELLGLKEGECKAFEIREVYG